MGDRDKQPEGEKENERQGVLLFILQDNQESTGRKTGKGEVTGGGHKLVRHF